MIIDGIEYELFVNGETADHMFDDSGSETFDLTQAVEAVVGPEFIEFDQTTEVEFRRMPG